LQNSYEALKKTDLEEKLDLYLGDNQSQFSANPKLNGYYSSRSRTVGSPIKKDTNELLKVAKRRVTKAVDEIAAAA
jgi:hypothetical protein